MKHDPYDLIGTVWLRKWWAVLVPKRARVDGVETSLVDGEPNGFAMKGENPLFKHIVAIVDDGARPGGYRKQEQND